MATKAVNPDDPGQAQVFLNDFLLARRSLTDFQAVTLLEAINYEWETGHEPYDLKMWTRMARPTNGRQKGELAELADIYDQHPLVLKMRLQRAEAIRRKQDWKFIRLAILERDRLICGYCGKPANTVDHITPRAQGGTHDPDNLIAACHRCNSKKNARTPEQCGMPILFQGGLA